jgi:hypothetical protein
VNGLRAAANGSNSQTRVYIRHVPDDTANAGDTPMTGIYVGAIAVEAAIIVLLWLFGRLYS